VEVIIYADGGCLNNGAADTEAYCSFKVLVGDEIKRHRTCNHLEAKTNNEAEYAALLYTLDYIKGVEEKTAKKINWTIYMDSELVVMQATGTWKCKAQNLIKFRDAALAWLQQHDNVSLTWVSGGVIKSILGH